MLSFLYISSRRVDRTPQASKMESIATIANGFWLLTIITKLFMVNVCRDPENLCKRWWNTGIKEVTGRTDTKQKRYLYINHKNNGEEDFCITFLKIPLAKKNG